MSEVSGMSYLSQLTARAVNQLNHISIPGSLLFLPNSGRDQYSLHLPMEAEWA